MLMFTYPDQYRLEREDEIITTLLDTTDPSHMWPSARQAADLLSSGCAVRAASKGAEDRRRGRERASWIASSVMAAVSSLVLTLWISGVFPSVGEAKFVGLWSPFIALAALSVWTPTKLLRRAGWISVACSTIGVIAGPEHTMAQRSLMSSLVLLGLVIATRPDHQASTRSIAPRLGAPMLGVVIGAALAIRINVKFDYLTGRGAVVLWEALPHLPGFAVPVVVAASLAAFVACLLRPSWTITLGLLFVPVGTIGFMLSSNAFFFTAKAELIVGALLACMTALVLTTGGIAATTRPSKNRA